MAKLENMTDEQLVADNQKLMVKRDELREKQFAIKAELDRRAFAAGASRLLDGLSDLQIQAVAAAATARPTLTEG